MRDFTGLCGKLEWMLVFQIYRLGMTVQNSSVIYMRYKKDVILGLTQTYKLAFMNIVPCYIHVLYTNICYKVCKMLYDL